MSQQKYEGLTDVQVSESRKKNGVNVLTPPLKDPWWKEFFEKFSVLYVDFDRRSFFMIYFFEPHRHIVHRTIIPFFYCDLCAYVVNTINLTLILFQFVPAIYLWFRESISLQK